MNFKGHIERQSQNVFYSHLGLPPKKKRVLKRIWDLTLKTSLTFSPLHLPDFFFGPYDTFPADIAMVLVAMSCHATVMLMAIMPIHFDYFDP